MNASGKDSANSAVWVAVSKIDLPAKKYFKIGEVAHLVGVEPHVLRYWQTQFPQIRPQKSRSGHRLYRRRDVQSLLAIKELLHVQRFTIAGARQALRTSILSADPDTLLPTNALIDDAEAEVEDAPMEPVARVDVIGLSGDALKEAMHRQLAEQTGNDVVQMEVHAEGVQQRAERRRREQLGFGFVPTERDVLLQARQDRTAILATRDREDAQDRRRNMPWARSGS